MGFQSLEEIAEVCQDRKWDFFEAVLHENMEECTYSREQSIEKMFTMWKAMQEAEENYEGNLYSKSGLVGGDGEKMDAYRTSGQSYGGEFIGMVMSAALKTAESNACMKRIVAAPTAGACGVLPAVLLSCKKLKQWSDMDFVESLYVAAGIGEVIATRAFIAGAAGGCQAEIGSAAAMAAGALIYLKGGSTEQIMHGVAMALKNLMGLVCDPVAGLVEVPCVKRNVIGAMCAVSSADMALAGIESKIPADQVIDAMRQVGEAMDVKLKETGLGGVAASSRGRKVAEELYKGKNSQKG